MTDSGAVGVKVVGRETVLAVLEWIPGIGIPFLRAPAPGSTEVAARLIGVDHVGEGRNDNA